MATLSTEKILQIQTLYAQYGIYSKVAKEVGCSPATVKKYALMNSDAVKVAAAAKKANRVIFTKEPYPAYSIILPITEEGWSKWSEFNQFDLESIESLKGEM